MAKTTKLSAYMTKWEKWLGFGYLIISLFFLPPLLHHANSLLAEPMGEDWLNIVFFCTNFFFVCYIFRRFLKKSLMAAGENFGNILLTALIGFVIYWICSFAYSYIVLMLFPDYVNLNDQSIADLASGNFAVMAICAIVLVPVAEEVLYRGVLFGTIQAKNYVAAYIISTIVFAAIHVTGYIGHYSWLHLALAFVQYLPAGIVLSWAYRKSGCIYVPILIHAVVNTIGIFATTMR